MEKINEAREKITAESQKIGGPLAQYIEEHVNSVLNNNELAEAVLAKSMSDLIKKIREKAKEHMSGGVGCVSDDQVKEMTAEFYGFSIEPQTVAAHEEAAHEEEPAVIDIFDLI